MGGSFMKYLFWGVMSFLALSCTAPSFEVCSTSGDTEEHRVVKTETRVEARSRNATLQKAPMVIVDPPFIIAVEVSNASDTSASSVPRGEAAPGSCP